MKLEGIHHITCITADAPKNVWFYAELMGLRLVKKTVNQDQTSVYHLFYADEEGDPGSDLTFFEFPGVPIGRAGAGMIYRITWRVGSPDALDFWAKRLGDAGYESEREAEALRFRDFEGLEHELVASESPDEPLIADHPEIPAQLALQGFDAARAYTVDRERSRPYLEETLEFTPRGDGWDARGERRGGLYAYDEAPPEAGIQAAGTVHHIAWASPP
jgi:glyoxalase family protein